MNAAEQGARRDRHHVIPRTLIFVTRVNPAHGGRDVLLIKGAPDKRLWANRYNGLGGHVEADEDVYAAAARELAEEAGLQEVALELRGVVHVDTGLDDDGSLRPGVMIFVFHGKTTAQAPHSTAEGALEWAPLDGLAELPLVDDLPELLARTLAAGPIFYGHYAPQPDGVLTMRFSP